jgi:hypothetical protein
MTARDHPAAGDRRAPWLRRGLILSLLIHALIGGAARWSLSSAPEVAIGEPTSVDIEIAPAAPAAEQLPDEVPVPPPPAPEPPPPAPAPEVVPAPAPEPEATALVRDAGVADAAAVAAASDAGADGDAGALALGPGGGDGDAGAVAMFDDGGVPSVTDDGGAPALAMAGDGGVPGDGGAIAAAGDGGVPGDGGAIAAAGDGGVGEGDPAALGAGGGALSAGTAADLLGYFPSGHVVSVLLRLDRVRGTEWSAATEKVLAPMPDYRALVGAREVHVADLFETLVVSSYDPRRVDATTLVARTAMAPAELRRFLDQPDAPVGWSVAQGGMLGRRGPSPRLFPGDQRVFLSPAPGWLVLAQPADLGPLTGPGTGELDAARAVPGTLPPWLERVQTIEAEAGAEEGPAVVVTVGSQGRRVRLPELGLGVASVPAPERGSLALTVDKRGFLVRGNLRFTSSEAAAEFVASATAVRTKVLELRVYSALLKKAKVYNAVKGLSLAQTGSRVSYATSISIADARALMAYAALVVADWYDDQTAPR